MMKFRCYSCNQKIGVKDGSVGRRVKCPVCGTHHTVPKNEVRWVEGEDSHKNPMADPTLLIETVAGLDSPAPSPNEGIQTPAVQIALTGGSRGLSANQFVGLVVVFGLIAVGVVVAVLWSVG